MVNWNLISVALSLTCADSGLNLTQEEFKTKTFLKSGISLSTFSLYSKVPLLSMGAIVTHSTLFLRLPCLIIGINTPPDARMHFES